VLGRVARDLDELLAEILLSRELVVRARQRSVTFSRLCAPPRAKALE
jgi:hypothetical protein